MLPSPLGYLRFFEANRLLPPLQAITLAILKDSSKHYALFWVTEKAPALATMHYTRKLESLVVDQSGEWIYTADFSRAFIKTLN